jgi:hypothetical protein
LNPWPYDSGYQFAPRIAIKQNGTIDVAWYDGGIVDGNPPNPSVYWNAVMIRSTDGLNTWVGPAAIGDWWSAAPLEFAGATTASLGTYLDLQVDGNYAYAAFASTAWGAPVNDALGDIFFDRVNNATFDDANGNGVPDFADILNGTSTDANGDGVPDDAQTHFFEFSLDIGSDVELSDPQADGDEAFDAGDVYWGFPGSRVSPPGRDGFKDDATIFAGDPWPDSPDPNRTTIVPVGLGSTQNYVNFFDLDGHDQTDFSLIGVQYPLQSQGSPCVHAPKYLILSHDDDMALGWPSSDVPVTTPAPCGISGYGTTVSADEVIGTTITVQPGPPPYPMTIAYPIADEIMVHQSLAPNPDAGDPDDNDVDSLDVVETPTACPVWYFSPDHEAHVGLDPGSIYQVTGTGPAQVIDEALHLGISEDADLNAFEFTVLDMPGQPGIPMLALLFSVDDDDPLTPVDESGGMNPAMLFVSWMTGFSMQFCSSFGDDVDALTIWRESLELGACCTAGGTAQQCTYSSQAACEQQQGEWKGPGTDCSDWDGNGTADVCELPPEACCYPDGSCAELDPPDCVASGGEPQGSGTTCETVVCPEPPESDLDGDGDTDLDDYAALNAAITGPGLTTSNPAADYDGDLDCDLRDFAVWVRTYPYP